MLAFEDETTITQKPCIRKSMFFEGGEQQKIEHTGTRKKFSVYISALWPDQILIYDFYDKMNSTNTIDLLENIKTCIAKNCWKRLIIIWDNASFHTSKMTTEYIKEQKHWLNIVYLPKKAPYLNPNERKINQQIKSDVCANRFYTSIEEQKDTVSNYLENRFGTWNNDMHYDT
jgi:transposase